MLEADTIQLVSLFDKVYVNEQRIGYPFILVLQKRTRQVIPAEGVKYSDKTEYNDGTSSFSNNVFVEHVKSSFDLSEDACWFAYDISVQNFDELHIKIIIVDKEESVEYNDSTGRSAEWTRLISEEAESYVPDYSDITEPSISNKIDSPYRQYITAIKTKPFLLLAGISGTGKSRIVRELARACWKATDKNTTLKNQEILRWFR